MYKLIVKILLAFSLCLTAAGCALLPLESGNGVSGRDSTSSSYNAGYHYMLGVLSAMDGQLDDAVSELEAAFREDPLSPTS